jgi:hypothetical protein
VTRTEFAPRLPFLQAWMDGKEVEWVYTAQTAVKWHYAAINAVPPDWQRVQHADVFTYSGVQFRLKPQPREWWICRSCKAVYGERPSYVHQCRCDELTNAERIVHVREVLPDIAGGAA